MKLAVIMRLCFIMVAVIICMQQVGILLMNFFTSDKWAMTITYKDVRRVNLPDIAICNSNQINVSLAAEIGINNRDLQSMIKNTSLEPRWRIYANQLEGLMTLSDVMFQAIVGGIQYSPEGVIPLSATAHMHGISPSDLQLFQIDLYELYYNKTQIPYHRLYRSLSHSCEESLMQCFTGSNRWDCCRGSEQLVTSGGVCTKLHPEHVRQGFAGSSSGYLLLYELRTDIYVTNIVDIPLASGITLMLTYGNNLTTLVSVSPDSNTMVKLRRIEEKALHAAGLGGSFFPPSCVHRADNLEIKLVRNSARKHYFTAQLSSRTKSIKTHCA